LNVLVGKPARLCKDLIVQHLDNINLYQAYYRTTDYGRKFLDNRLG